MFEKFRRFGLIVLSVVFLLAAFPSFAAEYPNKDIKVVCPWGAGGGVDGITRMITKIAEKYIPASFYVVNVEGGTGSIGAYEVMKSKPDGYTIGSLSYDHIVTVPRHSKEILPEYNLNKLKMICLVTREGGAMVVSNSAKWKNFRDFVEYAKKHPGKVTVALDGFGSGDHLRALTIGDKLGIKMKYLPYPGGAGQKKEALLSGEVDVAMTSLGDFAPLIQSGQARGLVVMEEERNKAFPDVPTFKEMGYDGLVMGSFVILAAPAGTPDKIIAKLENAFYKAHHSDEFRNWAANVGVVPSWLGSEAVSKMVRDTQTQAFTMLDKLVSEGIIKE